MAEMSSEKTAADNVDLISEDFLRFLESRKLITSKQISTLKNHRSPHRQLAIFKNIVAQKDVVNFQMFCKVLVDYDWAAKSENVDIRVPGGETTIESIIELDIRSPRSSSSPNPSASLPSLATERRQRLHSALRRDPPSSRPQTAGSARRSTQGASFNIQGISYDWNQSNQLDQLQKENAKLLMIIRESMSGLLKDIRDKDGRIAELEKELRQKEVKIVGLERDREELEARQEQESTKEEVIQGESATAPEEKNNTKQDATPKETPEDIFKQRVLPMIKIIPILFFSTVKLTQLRAKYDDQKTRISLLQLDMDETRVREMETPTDEDLRNKRIDLEGKIRKTTEDLAETCKTLTEFSDSFLKKLHEELKDHVPKNLPMVAKGFQKMFEDK